MRTRIEFLAALVSSRAWATQSSLFLCLIFGLACLSLFATPTLAQSFPVTISFDHSDWKPTRVAPITAWSTYGADPDPAISGAAEIKVSRTDINRHSYRFEHVMFDDDWLHFTSVKFENSSSDNLPSISLPVRLTREIVNPVDWIVKFVEPPTLPSGDTFEERVRKLRVSWDYKSKKRELSAELSRYLEARHVWQHVRNEGPYHKFVKFLAIRHALEGALSIQRYSTFGLYFDEGFVDEAIEYFDALAAEDPYRSVLHARIGEVIFVSWTQIGNAVPSRAATTSERARLCQMNRGYLKIGEAWLSHASSFRKRYWDFKPSTLNLGLKDIASRLEACDKLIAQKAAEQKSTE